ncbi:uncharacterized protein MELLADRAFT_111233 [Melampsora larici-populina 98AG31]|uniref:START domain-containing protein n=1 Tax=Melampsora larici-populina (strain 98AG31 / pathotype 3-4-7) TaxID=747676 RepID=F4S2G9_MELLP|nr:uncharacterized protein MELLADRAFT_111233 [Melampsora larici-populina 98AG31]EGG01175.1 hypothetical protein MELLADRAFT_111233 [Melampsora larici-populina 98AG31]
MDGSFEKTHQRYQDALNQALTEFKSLLSSNQSKHWKPIPPTATQLNSHTPFSESKPNPREFLNGIGPLDFANVQIHRKKSDGQIVVRAISDLWIDQSKLDIDDFKSILNIPEIRGVWDNLVDQAKVLEVLDSNTRIVKTDFRLGWPANPRDSITITKTFHDSNTIIDISTSLPPSVDEPVYLRPSPPFVRSHVHLLAWCIQFSPQPPPQSNSHNTLDPLGHQISLEELPTSESSKAPLNHKPVITTARITVFWKVNWKGAIFSTHHSQIASLLGGFIEYMRAKADRIPLLSSYGKGIDFGSTTFDKSEEKLTIEYAVVMMETPSPERTEIPSLHVNQPEPNLEDSSRLDRSIELKLPINQGWNVQISSNGQGEGTDETWNTVAEKGSCSSRTSLRIHHAPLTGSHQIVKVKVTVQRLAGGNSLRVNQNPIKIVPIESSSLIQAPCVLLDETKSISNLSVQTESTEISKLTADKSLPASETCLKASTSSTSRPLISSLFKRSTPATRANAISALLRRSYIYFSSLLQEPEAKWKHISDSRGVTVTQLQSIDPTLTVYRAEATFVGIGVWNVYSAINTIGARITWDSSLSDAILLEDLNDLSSLWQIKQKGSWPVAPRDSVLITTTYKSPTSVHIFSVSTDDSKMFPTIKPADLGSIRTRTEILGWSIEALSPTTTQITLIDQHDPMGWSPKSWTPAQLISQVAGVGEYALKSGGPPIITRVLGAKVSVSKYDHEKGIFRAEYSTNDGSLMASMQDPNDPFGSEVSKLSAVECEIRCDCETWANSLEIVVNPPPTKSTCLKRHKLSSGGGWWVMIEHDLSSLAQETVRISIRRGTHHGGKEKSWVILNGTSLHVDIEELSDQEVMKLSKRTRVKASLIPLDQYSLSGPRLWRNNSPCVSPPASRSNTPVPEKEEKEPNKITTSPTEFTPSTGSSGSSPSSSLPQSGGPPIVPPMICALEALAKLQSFHIEQGPDVMIPPIGWTLVSEKGNSSVYKKLDPSISDVFPVYRGDRVIEGVTAEEMVSVISAFSTRPNWDDRIESSNLIESYGNGCSTLHLITKPNFPFKGRSLQLSNIVSQMQVPSSSIGSSMSTVHFIASASFSRPKDRTSFLTSKLNSHALVEGNVLLEGWIMETIDPYSVSFHTIPSTRCTFFTSIDYRGSLPVAFNSMLNSSLPRLISGVERLVKAFGPLPKLCQPCLGLAIDGSLATDRMDELEWRLKDEHRPTVAVLVDAVGSERFICTVLLRKGSNEIPSSTSLMSNHLNPSSSTSLQNGTISNNLTSSRYDVVKHLRGLSSTVIGNHDQLIGLAGKSDVRRLVSNPDLRRKSSLGQIRRSGVNSVPNPHHHLNHLNHSLNPIGFHHGDLVVMEISIDRKLYPHGFKIDWKSKFVKENESIGLDPRFQLLQPSSSVQNHSQNQGLETEEKEEIDLPIEVSIHEMPCPAVFAASIDTKEEKREHLLLRMVLRLNSVHLNSSSVVQDPLRNLSDRESKDEVKGNLPGWYNELSQKNVLVKVSIVPLKKVSGGIGIGGNGGNGGNGKEVICNEKVMEIIPLLESQTELDRWECDNYVISPCSISRMNRTLEGSSTSKPTELMDVLPNLLKRPLVIGYDFLNPIQVDLISSPKIGSDGIKKMGMIDGTPQGLLPVLEDLGNDLEGLKNGQGVGTHKLNGDVLKSQQPTSSHFQPVLDFLHRFLSMETIIKWIETISKWIAQPTYTPRRFQTYELIMCCLISFLLGSFLRSLVLPSDWMIWIPYDQFDHREDHRVLEFLKRFVYMHGSGDGGLDWKEIVRVVELRVWGFKGWSLVLAAVKDLE